MANDVIIGIFVFTLFAFIAFVIWTFIKDYSNLITPTELILIDTIEIKGTVFIPASGKTLEHYYENCSVWIVLYLGENGKRYVTTSSEDKNGLICNEVYNRLFIIEDLWIHCGYDALGTIRDIKMGSEIRRGED